MKPSEVNRTDIVIYNPFGHVYESSRKNDKGEYCFPLTDQCERSATLMGDDFVRLVFNLDYKAQFDAFSYIIVGGQHFFLKEKYVPKSTDAYKEDGEFKATAYKYDVKFVSIANMLSKYTCYRHIEIDANPTLGTAASEWDEPEIIVSGTLKETIYPIIISSIRQVFKRISSPRANVFAKLLYRLVDCCWDEQYLVPKEGVRLTTGEKMMDYSFSAMNIADVLTQTCNNLTNEDYDTEWWIEEKEDGDIFLHVCKCEDTENSITLLDDIEIENLGIDKNAHPYVNGGLKKCDYEREVSDIPQVFTPYGATRNMSALWTQGTDLVTNMMVTYGKRLRLDPNTEYKVHKKGSDVMVTITTDEHGAIHNDYVDTGIETSKFYEDIYPQCHFAITSVERKDKHKSGVDYTIPEYTCTAELVEDSNYDTQGKPITKERLVQLGFYPLNIETGQTLSVRFESGFLNGREFEIKNKTTKDKGEATYSLKFTIVATGSTEDGNLIPSGNFIPREGDQFALFNMKMPMEFITLAKQQLAQRAYEELVDMQETRPALKCKTDPYFMTQPSGEGIDFHFGKRFNVKSEKFGTQIKYSGRANLLPMSNTFKDGCAKYNSDCWVVTPNVKITDGVFSECVLPATHFKEVFDKDARYMYESNTDGTLASAKAIFDKTLMYRYNYTDGKLKNIEQCYKGDTDTEWKVVGTVGEKEVVKSVSVNDMKQRLSIPFSLTNDGENYRFSVYIDNIGDSDLKVDFVSILSNRQEAISGGTLSSNTSKRVSGVFSNKCVGYRIDIYTDKSKTDKPAEFYISQVKIEKGTTVSAWRPYVGFDGEEYANQYLSRLTSFSYKITKPYEIDFTLASTIMQGVISNLSTAIADATSGISDLGQRAVNLSRRGWHDAAEMADMLDSITAQMMLVGDEHNQFAYTSGIECVYKGNEFYSLDVHYGELQHTQEPYINYRNGGHWFINESVLKRDFATDDDLDDNEAYYLFAECNENEDTCSVFLINRTDGEDTKTKENCFLLGILSSVYKLDKDDRNERVFNRTNGFTAISGGTITTEQIQDAGRNLIIDFSSNPPRIIARKDAIISGNIHFRSADDTEDIDAKEYIETLAQQAQKNAEKYVDALGEELQKQIDGVVNSYFYASVPEGMTYIESEHLFGRPTKEPNVSWVNEYEVKLNKSWYGTKAPYTQSMTFEEQVSLLKRHLGDTYTNTSSKEDDPENAGKSWRWCENEDNDDTTFHWHEIADSDAIKALQMATKALDVADGKRRVFTTQPIPPYDAGDLWVNATYTLSDGTKKYENELLACVNSKSTGVFSIEDWGKSSDAKVNADKALANLDSMASDSVISVQEKCALRKEWETIKGEYESLKSMKDKFIQDDWKKYLYAYSNLNKYLVGGFPEPYEAYIDVYADEDAILEDVGDKSGIEVFNYYFKDYYDCKAVLMTSSIDYLEQFGDNLCGATSFTFSDDAECDRRDGNKLMRLLMGVDTTISPTKFAANREYLTNGATYLFSIAQSTTNQTAVKQVSFEVWNSTNQTAPIKTLSIDIPSDSKRYVEYTAPDRGVTWVYLCATINNEDDRIRCLGIGVQKKHDISKYTKYLTDAFRLETEIRGGVTMTSVLMLRDEDDNVRAGMSGMSENVLMWGGATYEQAVEASEDNNYQYTSGSTKKEIPTLLRKDGTGKIGCFRVIDEKSVEVVSTYGRVLIDTASGGIRMYNKEDKEKVVIVPDSINEYLPNPSTTLTITKATIQSVSASLSGYRNDIATFSLSSKGRVSIKLRYPLYNCSCNLRGTRIAGKASVFIRIYNSSNAVIKEEYYDEITTNKNYVVSSSINTNFDVDISTGGTYKVSFFIKTIDPENKGYSFGGDINSSSTISGGVIYSYDNKTVIGNDGFITAYDGSHYFQVKNDSDRQKIFLKGISSMDFESREDGEIILQRDNMEILAMYIKDLFENYIRNDVKLSGISALLNEMLSVAKSKTSLSIKGQNE